MSRILRVSTLTVTIAVILLSVLSACSGGQEANKPDTTVISEAVLTTSVGDDSKPTAPAQTKFNPNVPAIYCSFKLSEVSQEAMIKVSWVYVKGEAANMENTVINETYSIASPQSASYYLALYIDKPAGGWQKGQYKVVLYSNNVEKVNIPFDVE